MSAATVSGGAGEVFPWRDLPVMTHPSTERWLRRLKRSVTLCAAGERRRAAWDLHFTHRVKPENLIKMEEAP
jgi:hypothetical protein